MCLIGIAHRVSADYPLVIAANRDEDYERPSVGASFWSDAPDVFGGRDALHGGSWLAITRGGRFAAVTNLRGAPKLEQHRSRGELVGDFVRGDETPLAYASRIRIQEYGGFHLLVGVVGGELVQISGTVSVLPPGIHSLSNAPAGERWAKMDAVEGALKRRQDWRGSTEALLEFLSERRDNIFIAGERYGTRASTVIVATAEEITFVEQTWVRGGLSAERYSLTFPISPLR